MRVETEDAAEQRLDYTFFFVRLGLVQEVVVYTSSDSKHCTSISDGYVSGSLDLLWESAM